MSILAKDSLKIEIELSRSGLFHMKTRFFLKYFVRACTLKWQMTLGVDKPMWLQTHNAFLLHPASYEFNIFQAVLQFLWKCFEMRFILVLTDVIYFNAFQYSAAKMERFKPLTIFTKTLHLYFKILEKHWNN